MGFVGQDDDAPAEVGRWRCSRARASVPSSNISEGTQRRHPRRTQCGHCVHRRRVLTEQRAGSRVCARRSRTTPLGPGGQRSHRVSADPAGGGAVRRLLSGPGRGASPVAVGAAHGRAFGLVFTPRLPFARSLAFTREAWEQAGGFPEHLGWQEDGNFGRAVSRHAECLVTVDAGMTWHQRGSLRGTYLMYRRYGFSGAQSGDRTLMGRDLLRGAAYVAAPLAVMAARRRALPLAAAGLAVYTSLPLRRLQRRRRRALEARSPGESSPMRSTTLQGDCAARVRRGARDSAVSAAHRGTAGTAPDGRSDRRHPPPRRRRSVPRPASKRRWSSRAGARG